LKIYINHKLENLLNEFKVLSLALEALDSCDFSYTWEYSVMYRNDKIAIHGCSRYFKQINKKESHVTIIRFKWRMAYGETSIANIYVHSFPEEIIEKISSFSNLKAFW